MNLTHEETLAALAEALRCGGDPEAAHDMADTALCDFLMGLGYADVVEAWNKVPKWYA